MSFKVTWKVHLKCFFISLIISFVLQDLINNLLNRLLIENKFIIITGAFMVDLLLYLVILSIPMTLVHEILHGAAYKLYGGKIKYGFKGIYAYTQETSGIALHRTKFLLVLLAPLTIISILSLIIPSSIGGIIFILNLLGSTGDIVMAFYLCRTNENSYIIDKKYGFDVINEVNFR